MKIKALVSVETARPFMLQNILGRRGGSTNTTMVRTAEWLTNAAVLAARPKNEKDQNMVTKFK